MENSKLNPNFLEITGIIDTDVIKDTKQYYASIGREFHADSKNTTYKAGNLLVFMSTYREREYTPSETQESTEKMSTIDRLKMEANMKRKGVEAVDYSVAKNATILSINKADAIAILGLDIANVDLSALVGKNANEVFPTFVQAPQRVRNLELYENICKLQRGEKDPATGLPFGWDFKTAGTGGVELTKGGKRICRKTVLADMADELVDVIIEFDNDLSANKGAVVENLIGAQQ